MGYYLNSIFPQKKDLVLKSFKCFITNSLVASEVLRENKYAVVCVVDNGPFEAVAYCYNESEFEAFNEPTDNRPKTWIVVKEKDLIEKLVGYKKS